MGKSDVVQGTLDMLILKTLAPEAMHGFGIGQRIEQTTQGVFVTGPGSFFPALRRLERKGWIKGEWGLSENNRRARYYSLTREGRSRLDEEVKNWRKIIFAVDQVLETNG